VDDAESAPRGRRFRIAPAPVTAAADWWTILREVKHRVEEHRLPITSAGLAFYALLSVVPALATLVSAYGLAFDADDVTRQLAALRGVVPGSALDLVLDQVGALQSHPRALGWSVAGGLLLTLWTSSVGVRALIRALNTVYDTDRQRSFVMRAGLSLMLTLGAIAVALVAIAAVVVLPAAAGFAGESSWLSGLVQQLRWPVLAGVFWLGAAVIYRYGPCRRPAAWRWVSQGAAVATMLWLAGSGAFSWYVSNFGRYNETYGSMGAVVILLLWLLLSAFTLLVGAEFSAELERRRSPGWLSHGRASRGYAEDTIDASPARGRSEAR
jgi:membrane protein